MRTITLYKNKYQVIKIENTGTSHGNFILIYEGEPARATGEYDTVSYSISYSHSITGTIEPSLKTKITTSLGYTAGKSVSFQISKNSASLNMGIKL